jgi:hypothetical protein
MCGSMQESEDMWAPTQESRATPHYCTISVWQTIVIGCFTLWIFQRLIRARGKRNESVKSREAASAPSIDAAECKPHQYDVFINQRGPDVKKSFVAHLNAALRRDGYRPFLDAKSIGQGRHVFNSIDRALKGACVHVAIFSKRYAESKYCLNELCDMLNSNHVILPVFYGVNPEDLRWIDNGPFKDGFQKHVQRGRREEIQKWKAALRKVADYRGFRLDEVNG